MAGPLLPTLALINWSLLAAKHLLLAKELSAGLVVAAQTIGLVDMEAYMPLVLAEVVGPQDTTVMVEMVAMAGCPEPPL